MLLAGIHLIQTGTVESNLLELNREFNLPYLPELVERKLAGPEKSVLPDADVVFYEQEYERLQEALRKAHEQSSLPEEPSGKFALHDLLVRVRKDGLHLAR